MDQPLPHKICASPRITALLEELREARGLSKKGLVRGIQQLDAKFSETQLLRIQAGQAVWTVERFCYACLVLKIDPVVALAAALEGVDGWGEAT